MKVTNSQFGNKNMQYVIAVDKYKSVSAAAESLYISQPALSRFIQSLEKRLGVKLFNRFGKQFLPTYEGERYIHYARQIIAVELQLENELGALLSSQRGRLRLALPTLRSSYLLPNVLPRFYEKHPKVEVLLHEVSSQNLEKLLLDGEVDLAFFNKRVSHPDIISIFVHRDSVLLAVPKNHPLYPLGESNPEKPCPSINITQFRDDRFILQNCEQRTRQVAEAIFSEADFTPNTLLVTRSIEMALKLVSSGLGVCFVAATYAKQIILSNSVAFFSIDSAHANVAISLAHLKNIYHSAYFIDFVNIVAENIY